MRWLLCAALALAACHDQKSRSSLNIQQALEPAQNAWPERIDETYLFQDGSIATPAAALHRYEVAVPLWSDGAIKSRFIFIPPGRKISWNESNESLNFPSGTTLVKHFAYDADPSQAIETRIMTLKDNGFWSFATYVWDAEGSHLSDRPHEEIRGGQAFRIPSMKECKLCHGENRGVLGFTLAQLNHESQLASLIDRDLFEDPSPVRTFTKTLPRPDQEDLSVEERTFSYLGVNCGPCHQPSGPEKAREFDLRWGASRRDDLLAKGKIVSGSLEQSKIWQRFHATQDRMPLLSLRRDPLGSELLEKWILHPEGE